MEHDLECRVKGKRYTYRLYPRYGTLRYAISIPIDYTGNGEWEMSGWFYGKEFWKKQYGNAAPDFPDVVFWIHFHLKGLEANYRMLTAVFEDNRLRAYRRIFRRHFELEPLRRIEKEYNGVLFTGWVVAFRVKGDSSNRGE